MSPRAKGYLAQLVCYVVALASAAAVVTWLPLGDPLWRAAAADVLATIVVFGFSVGFSNSSFYDAYWSVAPPALFAYWATTGDVGPRAMILGALVTVWAVRLTWNFLRGFSDLSHEDWRYRDLQRKHGRLYWLVSFGGIHMFPTVLTFAGSLSIYAVLHATPPRPLGWIDALAAAVTALGIAYEAIADEQLRAYIASGPPKGDFLQSGLWKHSRHPNYFGEVTFWWGLALFGFAAAPRAWWIWIGAAAITALFFFVSIPMIDARMVERRPKYAEHMKRVSRLIPWPRRA